MSAWDARAHLARNGRSRCGNGTLLAISERDVTCGRCLAMMAGTYGVGWRQPDEPCGTIAAYRRHYRHGERPCRSCRQAEARYRADQRRAA